MNPGARTDLIVNHEYGFVLVRLGDVPMEFLPPLDDDEDG